VCAAYEPAVARSLCNNRAYDHSGYVIIRRALTIRPLRRYCLSILAHGVATEHRAAYAAGPNRSSVTHGIGRVTDIPDQPYDLYIYRCLDHHNNVSLDTEQRMANESAFAQVHTHRP